MKYSILGFNQEAVCSISKTVVGKDGKSKLLSLDLTDLLIIQEIADFMNRKKVIKYTIEDRTFFSIRYELILEDLPIIGIKKQALRDRIDKMCKLGVLEKEVVRNETGSWTAFRLGNLYEELRYETPQQDIQNGVVKRGGVCSELHKGVYHTTQGCVADYTPKYYNTITNITITKKEKEDNKLSSIKENANELDFSIVAPEFMECVNTWLAYKKEKKQTYKPKGFVVFYKKLVADSNNNPIVAAKMIENSMANNYAGVFKLKDSELKSLHTTQKTLFDNQTQTDEELLQQFYENTTIAKEAEIYGVQDPYWFRQLNDQQLAYWRKQYKQKLLEWIKQNGNK